MKPEQSEDNTQWEKRFDEKFVHINHPFLGAQHNSFKQLGADDDGRQMVLIGELKQFIRQEIESAKEEEKAFKDIAYYERNQLVSVLSKLFESHLCRHPEEDKSWEDDWRWIVCIHAPTGQLTWHIHDTDKQYFEHLKIKDNHWDGHNTKEKYDRLSQITNLSAKQQTAREIVEMMKKELLEWSHMQMNRWNAHHKKDFRNQFAGGVISGYGWMKNHIEHIDHPGDCRCPK